MTWTYKLFGIPRTFDEFVDKTKQTGQKEVDVVLGSYNKNAVDYSDDRPFVMRHYFVELQSGKIKLRLGDLPVSLAVTRDCTETEERMKQMAKDTVTTIKQKGLEAKMVVQI